jgi:hypothetical protein
MTDRSITIIDCTWECHHCGENCPGDQMEAITINKPAAPTLRAHLCADCAGTFIQLVADYLSPASIRQLTTALYGG